MPIHFVGTIPGFVPHGDLVRAEIERLQPDQIALGIPEADIDALRQLMETPELLDEVPEIDGPEAGLLSALMEHGDVQVVPSPDLQAAMESGVPVVAVDMDDDTHTTLYTEKVKVRHLLQKGRISKKLEKKPLKADTPEALALAWDAAQLAVRPLAELEAAREQVMAANLKTQEGTTLAIIHIARLQGVKDQL